MTKPNWVVVNFSGGKDSTAMLLRLIELGVHIDEVVNCDTYMEFPAMYRHIEKVKKVVEESGIKWTTLKAEHPFKYYLSEYTPNRKNPELDGLKGMSWPNAKIRWCTAMLKTRITDKYFKELSKKYSIVHYVGLAADEMHRVSRPHNKQENHIHPLVEWGWVEKDCLEYCYSKGYDWEGLYEIFSRVSCWCCPLQTIGELRKLKEHFPNLWEELKDMDENAWRKFKWDYSVKDLEIRFDLEREFEAKGKSIRSREFFDELKKRLA